MELIQALRIDQADSPPRVAFVGAGGKTTAMFQCARQLTGPVLVTATTHLSEDQLDLADQHYFADDETLCNLERGFPPGITLLTGPVAHGSNRTLGVPADHLKRVHALTESHQTPLLIEADGSRQLPLKAPADHEPPIPEFVNLVVVVAGLSGLGKPLTPTWVHRPEIFGALADLQPGETITSAALAQVMTHPDGGLKNIPAGARRIALLNRADTTELQAQAVALQSKLLPIFNAVIVSSLVPHSELVIPHSKIYAVHEPVAAVILAAGESRRFGCPKQLLDWHGQPLIWHVANTALQAGLNPVIIVCGAQMDAIRHVLSDLPVELIHNPDWQQGQGASVRTGLQALPSVYPFPIHRPSIRFGRAFHQIGGILFMLADQPQIPVSLIRSLVNAHAQSLNPITGPLVDEQRANPVLFDRATFDDLLSLSGEAGGRQLFSKYPVDWIPWHDPLPLLDVDTPEDYQRLLEMDL